jgi:hypothetical protein
METYGEWLCIFTHLDLSTTGKMVSFMRWERASVFFEQEFGWAP